MFLLIRDRPDTVLAYTVKPVIYSGLAIRLYRIFCFKHSIFYLPLITGLGYAFTDQSGGLLRSFLRYFLSFLYKLGLSSSDAICFQNPDDLSLFKRKQLFASNCPSYRVWGSGVDLNYFQPKPLPSDHVFLLISRLLVDKGVHDYVNAARLVKKIHPHVVFRLVGTFDTNPSAISRDELDKWIEEGVIEYLGEQDSVYNCLADCRYYVLPSYREGTPRTVLEAMATRRPIITTDVPGCRETVVHGDNGFLVPARSPEKLASAMISMIEQPEASSQKMAQSSLERAKKYFDVCKVNRDLIEIMSA